MKRHTAPTAPPAGGKHVQGEGDYEAARRFDQAERRFVESGKVDEAARRAPPRNAKEADELDSAEETGRSHAKDEGPTVRRP